MLLWSVRFNTRSRACVCWPPENMLHHKLPAEPNCSHSTRQSIHLDAQQAAVVGVRPAREVPREGDEWHLINFLFSSFP